MASAGSILILLPASVPFWLTEVLIHSCELKGVASSLFNSSKALNCRMVVTALKLNG